MRVFTGSLSTESNSFSPVPTNLDSFKECFYAPAGTHPDGPRPTSAPLWVLRSQAKQRGWTVIEGLCTHAEPAAPVTRVAYEQLRDQLLDELKAALPVDMVLLGLHGAMIADGYDDCEGDILTRARAIAGPKAIVGAELDPHCHLTRAMTTAADVLVCYKEFPHTDFVERAEELVEIAGAAAAGRVKPVMSVFDCHMISSFPTSREPMRGFVDRMKALEGKNGVLSVSLAHCFPYGDVAEIGARVLVVTDNKPEAGAALAEKLGRELYALRGTTTPPFLPIGPTLDDLLAREGGPYVVADPADNAGGGAPSDNTSILRALIERDAQNVALGPLWDPVAVRFAQQAGEGARLIMRIGGKAGPHSGVPVDTEVTVTKLVNDMSQRFSGAVIPLGDCAALRIGGIDVVVNSRRTQARSPDLFANLGIDPLSRKILVVKSTNHFHAAFAPIAKEVLYVESDGPLARDHRRVPYTKIDRPMWPFVADPLGA
jgi:microcystin degradation protein MlrC